MRLNKPKTIFLIINLIITNFLARCRKLTKVFKMVSEPVYEKIEKGSRSWVKVDDPTTS